MNRWFAILIMYLDTPRNESVWLESSKAGRVVLVEMRLCHDINEAQIEIQTRTTCMSYELQG